MRAILLPRLLPTPVLAFAVRHLGADAGVMVTASHNPPDDNGYKVYLGGADDGAQIVPPADGEIAAHIQRIADDGDVSGCRGRSGSRPPRSPSSTRTSTRPRRWRPRRRAPKACTGSTRRCTASAGRRCRGSSRPRASPAPVVVDEQIEPDGGFPTVAFPNPEEPGAMDLAFEAARSAGAELVIANDPDADRLAVALPDDQVEGGWRRLTGNEIGLLLGWRAARLAQALRQAQEPDFEGPGASLACSLVSSPGLQTVAAHYGLDFHATLTGFKWISRAPGLVFGFEEALGYLVNPETVRDKDGLSATIAMLGMVAEARGRGATLRDLLREFDETFGSFASDQISIRVDDLAVIGRMMSALRAHRPAEVGGVEVTQIDDLLDGASEFPPSDVLRLWLADGSRLIVRPSGTEPKLKLYLDVRGDSAEHARAKIESLGAGARAMLDAAS